MTGILMGVASVGTFLSFVLTVGVIKGADTELRVPAGCLIVAAGLVWLAKAVSHVGDSLASRRSEKETSDEERLELGR